MAINIPINLNLPETPQIDDPKYFGEFRRLYTALNTLAAYISALTPGSGNFVGPASSVNGDVVVFNGVTGKLGKDTGLLASHIVQGPASSVADHIALFDGVTGKLLKDGGSIPLGTGDVVGPASSLDGNLAVFDGLTGKLIADGGIPFRPTNIADFITTFGSGTDNTTGLNNAIAAAINGNGMLYIGGYVRADGAVVIPNDGNTSYPKQKPLRIFGAVAAWNSYLTTQAIPLGASVLDLRYNGGGAQLAKIDTRGGGLLEIDHLVLKSGGTDDYLFIRTTNTTVQIHHNCILGHTANVGTTCVQNFIRLGGDGSGTNQSLDDQAFFQGYGSKFNDNIYDRIQFAHIYGSQCNGIEVQNETIPQTCGSAAVHGAPFTFEKGPGGGQFAISIRAGTVEITNYKHVIKLDATTACVFDSISAYDDSMAYFESFVYSDAFSSGCMLIATWFPQVPFTGPNKNEHTLLMNSGFRVVHTSTVARLNPATFLGLGGFQYDNTLNIPIFSDGTIWRDAMGNPV